MASKRSLRVKELADEISEAVKDEQVREAVETLAELRRLGLAHRSVYRLTSPYGSGMHELATHQADPTPTI